jgi:non-ribosomal peptide synthetase-like protein
MEPLRNHFVRRSEFITGVYENIKVPQLLGFLLGTPFASPIVPLLGIKLGKKVLLLTAYMKEFGLVEIRDESAINPQASLQTHLFEDKVMKMPYIRIDRSCSIGEHGAVLYYSEMKEGACMGILALLMKGKTLGKDSDLDGSPAQPVLRTKPMLYQAQEHQTNDQYEDQLAKACAGLKKSCGKFAAFLSTFLLYGQSRA